MPIKSTTTTQGGGQGGRKQKEKQGKKGKQLPRTAKGQCRKVEVYNNNKKCD